MKYELETIPVWDALKTDTECLLCVLEKRNEEKLTTFFLGESVMDPDSRVAANTLGFCPSHAEKLFDGDHKLGVALMTHTYLAGFLAEFKKKRRSADTAADGKKGPSPLKELLARPLNDCIFCRRLAETLDRYAYTVLYLYRKDPDFRKTLLTSKGFCVPHLLRLLEMTDREMKGKERETFLSAILELEEKRFSVLEEEIDWFTQKFDYRNREKPWGNSRDALARTLQKLKGHRFLGKK
ncbi:MAG TPA: hypothetical protein ENN69_01665 [Spirochaetia bacterium]|nr:hypothetical protein [Spirochaetia bacterium]